MKVLITGASSGIGLSCAELFLKNGHEVIGFDREKAVLEKENYTHYTVDIRDEASYPDVSEIEVLVNCAGVQNEDDIDVNLKGTINITEKYGITPSIKSIVMIGSSSGHTGAEFPEYAASKGGVLAYTKNVALRVARFGATCNSLDFGGVLTPINIPVTENEELFGEIMSMTPLKRWMSPEEAAEWIYFMAAVNRFCTGQNILIDGGEAGNCKFVWPEE
ncbi:MAG: SDR family oxidoreductase [Eubacterium sp.]|nr:SDR family oxidoreductase [Eubacterium sp.]